MKWWGPNNSGYTPNLNDAGKYTEIEIQKFIGHEKEDLPILCTEIDAIAREFEYNYTKWKLGRFVINDELFWNSYNIDAKKLFYKYKGGGDKRYFRYPIIKKE
jgi:hypothetical protein